MRGSKNQTSIPAHEFYTHFKDVVSSEQVFEDENIESAFRNDIRESIVQQLDCEFLKSEVLKAIKSLKRGKSIGADQLLPEVFIEGAEILAPLLCKLFNYMYDKSLYPDSWTRGIIVPVPKK